MPRNVFHVTISAPDGSILERWPVCFDPGAAERPGVCNIANTKGQQQFMSALAAELELQASGGVHAR